MASMNQVADAYGPMRCGAYGPMLFLYKNQISRIANGRTWSDAISNISNVIDSGLRTFIEESIDKCTFHLVIPQARARARSMV